MLGWISQPGRVAEIGLRISNGSKGDPTGGQRRTDRCRLAKKITVYRHKRISPWTAAGAELVCHFLFFVRGAVEGF